MAFKNPFKKETPVSPPTPQPTKTTPKRPFLTEIPVDTRVKKPPVYQIYRFVYSKPIAIPIMEKNGITKICPHLYHFVELLIQDVKNSFHMIPAVRAYFGEALFKDFGVWYNRTEDYLVFTGINESDDVALRFTKEIALYVVQMLSAWMMKYKIVLSWRLDGIQFITEEKAKSTDKWCVDWDLRIAWVPD